MKKRAWAVCGLLLVATAAGACVWSRRMAEPPARVAVVPFTGEAISQPVLRAIRIAFVNGLRATACEVLDPFEVDRKLATPRAPWQQLKPEVLADLLKADAVIEGTVKKLSREPQGLRTRVDLTLAVMLRDLKTDAPPWSSEQRVLATSSGPDTPQDAADELLGRFFGWPNAGLIEAADKAARKLIGRMPLARAGRAPTINAVRVEPRRSIVSPGTKLEIEVHAARKLQLAASLATGESTVALEETKPGVYCGSYTISKQDEAPLTAVLVKIGGQGELSLIDPLHAFTVDATPPDSPTGVTLSTRPGAVRLDWAPQADSLMYRIERRVAYTPFEVAGETHNPWLLDSKAKPSAANEYRIVAIDAAGNESAPSPPALVRLPQAGSTTLPPRFDRDAMLPAYGSPYLMGSNVTIAEGATLTLEAGTVVHGLGHALIVRGTLLAIGTLDAPIVFREGSGEPRPSGWEGILFDGAGSKASELRGCEIEGARHGIACGASDPTITDCGLARNVNGLECIGGAAPRVHHCRFKDNLLRAVFVRLGHPELRYNDFSPPGRVEIERQSEPVDLDDNWWGVVEPSRIRDRLSGPGKLTRCLDSPPPFGSPVRIEAMEIYERSVQTPLPLPKARLLLAATEADPSFVRAYVELAYLYSAARSTRNATEVMRRCAERNPDTPMAWVYLARLATEQKDPQAAREAFSKAAQLDRNLPAAEYGLGTIAADAGRLDEAIEHLSRYAELVPSSSGPLRLLGEAFARQMRLVEAQRALRQAIDVAPREPLAEASLANVLLALGQDRQARIHFATAVDQSPTAAYLRKLYGAALIRLGEINAAAVQWAEAVRLQPDAKDARQIKRMIERAKKK